MIQIGSNPGELGRTPAEIIFAILTVVNGSHDDNIGGKRSKGATKMRIMADTFISFNSAREYIEKLQHDDLIEYQVDTNSYRTTERGKQLLFDSR